MQLARAHGHASVAVPFIGGQVMYFPVTSPAFLILVLRADILAANWNDSRNFGGNYRAGCNAQLQRAQHQVPYQIFNCNTLTLQPFLFAHRSSTQQFYKTINPSDNFFHTWRQARHLPARRHAIVQFDCGAGSLSHESIATNT
jgi:hypothetical protein